MCSGPRFAFSRSAVDVKSTRIVAAIPYGGSTVTAYEKTSNLTLIGGTLT